LAKQIRPRTTTGLHTSRFPGEQPAYRAARNRLLKAEIKLRGEIEAVAALRRKLPLGGVLKEDYAFDAGGRTLRMSELFAAGKDTLLIYSFMFGPEMKSACSSCTSILDGLDGQVPHVTQRVNMAVVANRRSSGSRRSQTDAAGATSGCSRQPATATTTTTTAKPQTARRFRP
jgi:predicted dithiol-disulfide oxidoreductase (DUF899 family)